MTYILHQTTCNISSTLSCTTAVENVLVVDMTGYDHLDARLREDVKTVTVKTAKHRFIFFTRSFSVAEMSVICFNPGAWDIRMVFGHLFQNPATYCSYHLWKNNKTIPLCFPHLIAFTEMQ